ncbi:MarR family winged helix-turn-helix transcriptional regulator [Microbispora bryophytorum]|uniref:MarR family transcriptional regulator n=1 Tax=Microbispora bryophytorum TaxID=1460882 RepID=A0A8H9H3Z2_9ACTN|nr:MarR family winged helix-turn-helix transcriptional regulator [Microbispora bryophytorum]MBD3138174.1 winged helix-turn-helix transcriptional regulator [Microbispora bryophytorum]TQS03936.1 winged helix-turn-helix transcriptional regulator [Microbispora bryophytorum]GGO25165.1 MarR family transcriptional regulator [Microbispora bryophytorum]
MSDAVSEAAAQAAGDTWVAVSRLVRRLRELDAEGDLSSGQASVLVRLAKHGPASASELAAAERVRPQSMAAIVQALERAGLVERHRDPEDGRRQLVTLTEPGRERRLDDRRAREAWLARALQEHCTEAQLRTITEAMALLDAVAQS